jgi:hypothetical protein
VIERSLLDRLVRQLKGVQTIAGEAILEVREGSVLSSLLRDLVVKSQSALSEIKKEPVKA